MSKDTIDTIGIISGILAYLLLAIGTLGATLGAWITHVVWAVKLMMSSTAIITGGKMALIILGILVPPVGMVHGWILWF